MKGCLILELLQQNAPAAKRTRVLGSFYFFLYISFGALYTMLPLFLQGRGLSGTQIGTLTALGPVVTLLIQPIWGVICDRYQAQRIVLAITLALAALFSVLYPFSYSFPAYLLLFAAISLFNSSGTPIIDSISLAFVQKNGGDYGNFRLWGSIGFAFASWLAGKISDMTNLSSIFWIYAAATIVCVLLTRSLPQESESVQVKLTHGLSQLFRMPRFLLFLLGTFLIFGTMQANNSYYGIFFRHIGGSVTGVGLSFLIAAGSEAPVMRVSGWFLRRFGIFPLLVVAGLISSLRWLFYGMAPSPVVVMCLLFVQGLSVGLFLPAAAQFVREVAPKEIQVTAMAVYSAIGNGLGQMAGTFTGGVLLDQVGIFKTYSTFGVASLVGVVAMFILRFYPAVHQSKT